MHKCTLNGFSSFSLMTSFVVLLSFWLPKPYSFPGPSLHEPSLGFLLCGAIIASCSVEVLRPPAGPGPGRRLLASQPRLCGWPGPYPHMHTGCFRAVTSRACKRTPASTSAAQRPMATDPGLTPNLLPCFRPTFDASSLNQWFCLILFSMFPLMSTEGRGLKLDSTLSSRLGEGPSVLLE